MALLSSTLTPFGVNSEKERWIHNASRPKGREKIAQGKRVFFTRAALGISSPILSAEGAEDNQRKTLSQS